MLNISPVTSHFVECHVDLMYNSLAPEPVVIAAAHVHCVFFDIECGRDPEVYDVTFFKLAYLSLSKVKPLK